MSLSKVVGHHISLFFRRRESTPCFFLCRRMVGRSTVLPKVDGVSSVSISVAGEGARAVLSFANLEEFPIFLSLSKVRMRHICFVEVEGRSVSLPVPKVKGPPIYLFGAGGVAFNFYFLFRK